MKTNPLKFVLLFLLIINQTGIRAQEAVLTQGGEYSGNGGSMSYSLGQVAYLTSTGANGSVAQGVQQPFEISELTGIYQTIEKAIKCEAFPNPTNDYLLLNFDVSFDMSMVGYQIFSLDGQLLDKEEGLSVSTVINMNEYKKGAYFLKVTQNSNDLKIFKIIKN